MTKHYHWKWVDTFQGGRNIDIFEGRNHIAITFTEKDAKRIIAALRRSSDFQNEREKVLVELEKMYPENTWITQEGDLVGGWELNPKHLRRLKTLIEKTPSYECEPDLEEIEIVILAIKQELRQRGT